MNNYPEFRADEDALEKIVQWADSYPVDIFHEPNEEECARAHEALMTIGLTLDCFSAAMGRHIVKGIREIALEGLGRSHECREKRG